MPFPGVAGACKAAGGPVGPDRRARYPPPGGAARGPARRRSGAQRARARRPRCPGPSPGAGLVLRPCGRNGSYSGSNARRQRLGAHPFRRRRLWRRRLCRVRRLAACLLHAWRRAGVGVVDALCGRNESAPRKVRVARVRRRTSSVPTLLARRRVPAAVPRLLHRRRPPVASVASVVPGLRRTASVVPAWRRVSAAAEVRWRPVVARRRSVIVAPAALRRRRAPAGRTPAAAARSRRRPGVSLVVSTTAGRRGRGCGCDGERVVRARGAVLVRRWSGTFLAVVKRHFAVHVVVVTAVCVGQATRRVRGRASFLGRRCGGRRALLARVRALFRERAFGLLDVRPVEDVPLLPPLERLARAPRIVVDLRRRARLPCVAL